MAVITVLSLFSIGIVLTNANNQYLSGGGTFGINGGSYGNSGSSSFLLGQSYSSSHLLQTTDNSALESAGELGESYGIEGYGGRNLGVNSRRHRYSGYPASVGIPPVVGSYGAQGHGISNNAASFGSIGHAAGGSGSRGSSDFALGLSGHSNHGNVVVVNPSSEKAANKREPKPVASLGGNLGGFGWNFNLD